MHDLPDPPSGAEGGSFRHSRVLRRRRPEAEAVE
jgi:hypothetical protein